MILLDPTRNHFLNFCRISQYHYYVQIYLVITLIISFISCVYCILTAFFFVEINQMKKLIVEKMLEKFTLYCPSCIVHLFYNISKNNRARQTRLFSGAMFVFHDEYTSFFSAVPPLNLKSCIITFPFANLQSLMANIS